MTEEEKNNLSGEAEKMAREGLPKDIQCDPVGLTRTDQD